MKISEQNTAPNLEAYVRQVNNPAQNEKAAETQTKRAHQRDSVELSQNAKDLQAAQEMVSDVHDIRAEKVARLKAQIENGTYTVDEDKTAKQMLKDSLMNEML